MSHVVPGNSDVSPTGDVAFRDDGTELGTAPLSGQKATWTGQLPLGVHPIVASQQGDSDYTAAVSDPLPLRVANVPVLGISVAGGDPCLTLTSAGTWSSTSHFDASSDATNGDYPHTVFSLALTGIPGMSAADFGLQQDIGAGWEDVALIDASNGDMTATVGADSDLSPGLATGVTLRLRALKGTPAGSMSMAASLLTSPDRATWNTVLASETQPVTRSGGGRTWSRLPATGRW